MAVTVTKDTKLWPRSKMMDALARGLQFEIGTITMDSQYDSFGEAVTFGISSPDFVMFCDTDKYVVNYDKTNAKVRFYSSDSDSGLIEIAESTDLSTTPGTISYFAVKL